MRIRLKCHDVIFHFALVQHCATVSRSPNLVRRVAIAIDDIITHYLTDVNTIFRAVAKNLPGPLTRCWVYFLRNRPRHARSDHRLSCDSLHICPSCVYIYPRKNGRGLCHAYRLTPLNLLMYRTSSSAYSCGSGSELNLALSISFIQSS